MNPPDAQLLGQYAEQKSEAAFAELTRRHFDLVYSAAVRQVGGDAELARDVAQTVFADLARKARSLADRSSLAGWLYTSTHFAAAKLVRGEQRRRAREQEASLMQQSTSDNEANWEQIRLTIDRAMHELQEREREAILLRFFQQRELRSVGEALGVSEDAARKRVERALDKLRCILGRHGLKSSSIPLGACLTTQSIIPAPAGLAASISGAAFASSAATSVPAALQTIVMNKSIVIASSALVLACMITPLLVQQRSIRRLKQENLDARAELARYMAASAAEGSNPAQSLIDAAELERLRGEHLELLRLRGEVARLRQFIAGDNARTASSAAAAIPATDNQPGPFAEVTTNSIPGRYRWIEGDTQGNVVKSGMVTLHPDGTFTAFMRADGQAEKVDAYRWRLNPGGLMVAWRNGIALFHNVAAPGVYLGAKEYTGGTLRMEKME